MSVAIRISIGKQQLQIYTRGKTKRFAIASALNGVGQQQGSEKTPLGLHQICEKIGANAPVNAVFVARTATGEIYAPELARRFPGRDWILTRILWLSGLEPGFNAGGQVDTRQRYIYIHGCPDTVRMGVPSSHGCIRMHNADLLEVFDRAVVGDMVVIEK